MGLIAGQLVDDAVVGHVVVDYALQEIVQPPIALRLALEDALSLVNLRVKDSAALEEQFVGALDVL